MIRSVIVVVALCLCAGMIALIWLAFRAACRKLGLSRRYQLLVPSGACAIGLLALWVASLDRLDALERTCRDAVLNAPQMQGATDLQIEKHYDFWTRTISGGGWSGAGWTSRPYEEPKVWLIINFTRDNRRHNAFITCMFSKVPNTGEPPQLVLQNVQF